MPYASGYGLQTLGRGIRDIGAVAGETTRRREAEEKAKEQEAYARKRDRFGDELTLADRGGGFGAPPPATGTIMGRTGPTEPGSGLEEPGLTTPLERTPNQEVTGPYDQERYGVGGADDDKYYWQRQEWTAKNAADLAEQRDTRLREQMSSDIAGGIGRVASGGRDSETFGKDAADLLTRGVDPLGFLQEDEDEVDEFERAGKYNALGYGPSGAPHPTGSSAADRRNLPTVNQVKEDVDEAGELRSSFWYTKNDADRLRYAIAMANEEANPFAAEMEAWQGPDEGAEEEGGGFHPMRAIGTAIGKGIEAFGRGFGDTAARATATRDAPAIPVDAEPIGGPSPRSWPRVGPAARSDPGPGTHSVRPPEEGATPGSDIGEISRARVRVGPEAGGIGPGGSQPSHNMADQGTLDELWSYLQALPDGDIIPHMIDNDWTPSDIDYIQGLIDERSQGLRQPVPEPLPL